MRRGFTLLEAIIVVTLLGLVGQTFGYLASLSQRLMIQSMGSSTSQGEAAFALEHIKRYVTLATAITVPAAVGGSGDELQFTWQPSSAVGVNPRTSRYYVAGTDLMFDPDTGVGGADEIIARGIQTGVAITDIFTRAVAGTVSVNVTARKTTGGNTQEMHLQTNISPRGLSQ